MAGVNVGQAGLAFDGVERERTRWLNQPQGGHQTSDREQSLTLAQPLIERFSTSMAHAVSGS